MTERREVFEFQKKQEERLDHFLVESLPEFSRSRLQALDQRWFCDCRWYSGQKSRAKTGAGFAGGSAHSASRAEWTWWGRIFRLILFLRTMICWW